MENVIQVIQTNDLEKIGSQWYDQKGRPICGAKKHNCDCGYHFTAEDTDLEFCPECDTPRPCRKPVPEPGKRCRFHGGNSLKGMEHGNYTTGTWSKYMPRNLLIKVQEAYDDRDLMHLRRDVALLEGLLNTLFENMDSGESESTWMEARKVMKKLQGARARGDANAAAEHLDNLEGIINHGANQVDVIREVRAIINQRVKLIESERKRMVQMNQMVTSEQLMMVLTNISDSIRRHVTDETARKAIGNDIQSILGKTR